MHQVMTLQVNAKYVLVNGAKLLTDKADREVIIYRISVDIDKGFTIWTFENEIKIECYNKSGHTVQIDCPRDQISINLIFDGLAA